MSEKKKFLLRIDAGVYNALEKWAADDLRSINAQMEFLLNEAVKRAGRSKAVPARTGQEKPDAGSENSEWLLHND
jgi:hypothetical protein